MRILIFSIWIIGWGLAGYYTMKVHITNKTNREIVRLHKEMIKNNITLI